MEEKVGTSLKHMGTGEKFLNRTAMACAVRLRINKWWWLSCRRMRIDPFLFPCTKLKSKWIKELHIKPVTLKLVEEKVGKSLEDMGTGEKFLNRTAMSCAVRSRIDKWDLIKLQSFCKAKDKKTTNRLGKDLYLSQIGSGTNIQYI